MIEPGCGLRELIDVRKRAGSHDIDVDAYCSKILLDMITGQIATVTTGDERTIQIADVDGPPLVRMVADF